MTPETINLDNLPEPWKELHQLLKEMKISRASGDSHQLNGVIHRIAIWRDAHPEEATTFVKHVTNELASAQPPSE